MNEQLRDPRDEIVEMHFQIIRVANLFVSQTARFSIEEMKEHNDPTYDEVATDAKLFAGMLKDIASIDIYSEGRLAYNALQAANLMEQMANAINKQDKVALDRAAGELRNICPI